MSAPAVIQGSYADLRFVKGRKVAQITVEIPMEAGEQFVSIFGTPNPAAEVPVAIARLDVSQAAPVAQIEKPRRTLTEMSQPTQAGLCCQSQAFQRFLYEHKLADEMSEDAAAEGVRKHLGVASRADIGKTADTYNCWNRLYDRYVAWKAAA